MQNLQVPNYFKVGFTSDLAQRLERGRTFAPFLSYFRVIQVPSEEDARELEAAVQASLRKFHSQREWFYVDRDFLLTRSWQGCERQGV